MPEQPATPPASAEGEGLPSVDDASSSAGLPVDLPHFTDPATPSGLPTTFDGLSPAGGRALLRARDSARDRLSAAVQSQKRVEQVRCWSEEY